MAERDGNGWVRCDLGHRHWGRFGAAGLLVYVPGPDGPAVLLQRRSLFTHHGLTWGIPGGARDSHESAIEAALREADEEGEVPASAVQVEGVLLDDHGGWSYRTVLASATARFPVFSDSAESDQADWVDADRVSELKLHPGFAGKWPELRGALAPLTVIVDAANVMGSRPDGWWRDRPGAATRLHGDLVALGGRGVAGSVELAGLVGGPELERWFPGFVLVLEGAARAALDGLPAGPAAGRVRAEAATGSGDDLIAELAGGLPGRRLVVTADRELRGRCQDAGASVAGPRWLLGLLSGPGGSSGPV
jgi:8-oxo-dGTP pyrophosphatase MutT (NUDIX family)